MIAAARPGCAGPDLAAVREKVLAGERLDPEDGLSLVRSRDIFSVGELADHVRRRLHGRAAYYNVNRHINYTNFCVLRCKFCSFYRPFDGDGPAATDGYELSIEQVVGAADEAYRRGAAEVHFVGGLHPRLPFSYYTELCRAIKARCPEIHVKAFTAIEIVRFTRIARPRRGIEDVLVALREAGLDSLPGPTGLDDLRTLAVARLMLDNFPHIKAFWIMQSPKLAQAALNRGADDFDGTVGWYDITKREGRGTNRQELTVDRIRRMMTEAGCIPVERDTLYRALSRDASGQITGRPARSRTPADSTPSS